MKKYIYTRVSTADQTTENQTVPLLKEYPDAEVYEETGSAYKSKLPIQKALIKKLKKGDMLIIWSIDRLGRRLSTLSALFDWLIEKEITLVSRREGVDLSTLTGRLVANIFGSIAQVEAEIISERSKAGMARARAEGKQIGREEGYSAHYNQIKAAKGPRGTRKDLIGGYLKTLLALHKEGMSQGKIAAILSMQTGIEVARSTVGRHIREYKQNGVIA